MANEVYFLETKQQAIDYLTNILNAHNPKNITPESMKYWMVSDCQLSARNDYWLMYGNSQECVKFNRNCLAGVWGYAVHRITAEVTRCVREPPNSYVQRQYDKIDANGKIYVLSIDFERTAKNIILIKQKFDITLAQARDMVDTFSVWFYGEKMQLESIKNLCATQDISLKLELRESIESVFCEIDFSFDKMIENGVDIYHFNDVKNYVKSRVQ